MSVPTTLTELSDEGTIMFNTWKEKGISMLKQISDRKYYDISSDPLQKIKDEEKMKEYNKIKDDLQSSYKPAFYILVKRFTVNNSDELIGKLLMGGVKNLIEKNPSQFPILDKDIDTSSLLDSNFISTDLLQNVINTLKELKELPSPKGHQCFLYEMLALFYVVLLGRRTFNRAMRKTPTPLDVQLADYATIYNTLEKDSKDFISKVSSYDAKKIEEIGDKVFVNTYTPSKTIGPVKYYNVDDKFSIKKQSINGGTDTEGMNIINLLVNKGTRHYIPYTIGTTISKDNKEHALINEFISGLTLDDLIIKGITSQEKTRIEQNIRKVVNSFHNAGFLHLDIQPQNIIIQMDNDTIIEEDPVLFMNFEQSFWMAGSLVAYTTISQLTKNGQFYSGDYAKIPQLTKLSEPIGDFGNPRFKSPSFQNWITRFSAKSYSSGTTANPETRQYSGEKYYFTQNDDNYALEETIKLVNAAVAPAGPPRWTKPKTVRLLKKETVEEDEENDMNFYSFCRNIYDLRSQLPV